MFDKLQNVWTQAWKDSITVLFQIIISSITYKP